MNISYTKLWLKQRFQKAFLTPIKALKLRYVPLLLIYFSYGLSGISAIALTFWEKEDLALSAEQLISISVWTMVPWTLKMIFGQMVDSVALGGSRRKVYIFVGAILMVAGVALLGGLAGRYDIITQLGSDYSLYLTAMLLLTFGFVIQDVTADTMSTEVVDRQEINEKGKLVPRKEKDIQADLAMVQVLGRLSLMLALFLVVGLGGYLAQRISYESIFWLMLGIPFISCLGVLFIRLDEPKKHEQKPLDRKILGGGLIFAVFSMFMAFSDFLYAQEIVFVVSLVLLVVMMKWITRHMDEKKLGILFSTLIALFVFRAIPKVGPGVQWWAIDVLGFDADFFGVLKQISYTIPFLLLWLMSDFITKKSVRAVLLFLVLAEALMSLPELGLYFGIHEALGIDARTVALFDTALESPLDHFAMIPVLSVIAFYAPAGYRGTWFAIGSSLMNLALTAREIVTKYLNKMFVITREVVDEAGNVLVNEDYDELGILMIVRLVLGLIVPVIVIVLLLRQSPRVKTQISEDISEEGPIPPEKKFDV